MALDEISNLKKDIESKRISNDKLKSKNAMISSALWRTKEDLLQFDTQTLTKQ